MKVNDETARNGKYGLKDEGGMLAAIHGHIDKIRIGP